MPAHNPTVAEMLDNHKVEHLYNNEFDGGRFFRIVFQNETCTEIRLAPKTSMQVTFYPDRNDIEGIEIRKIVNGIEQEKVSFHKFNIQQLKSFLSFINEIDLQTISSRRLKIADDSLDILDEDTKKQISTLLMGEEGAVMIQKLLDNEVVTSQDIVNTGYRKAQLEIFRKMLDEDYLNIYKEEEISLSPSSKDEIAWQHFFNKNQWIFGYGLNYRFEGVLQKEFSASDTDASGKEQVNTDFLLGDKNFTTFVELKKSTTDLFGNRKNRSGCWSLSQEITDSVSQILEQKASGLIKLEQKELYDSEGNEIKQKAYDSKCILVIGNLQKQIDDSDDAPKIKTIKKKTFELYRRDLRNVEIITYDELYNRAYYIVNKE